MFDADLSAYFDTIPHRELLILVGMRISDKNIIHLIKMWLKAPIIEDGKTKGGKKNKIGTPQGGVISPLLANIYLNLIDKAVNRKNGVFNKCGIRIVRYADDFVLMGRTMPTHVLKYLNVLLGRMKLTLNTEKSHMVNAKKESFDFLGFTFRFDGDIYGRARRYWNVFPSKKSQKKVRGNIDIFLKKNSHKSAILVSKGLNSIIRGWINYFSVQKVSYPKIAKKDLRFYLSDKFWRYYQRKSQRKCKLYNRGAFQVLVDRFGLIDPTKYV